MPLWFFSIHLFILLAASSTKRTVLAEDSAFNHTILNVFQTASGPAMLATEQVAFDPVMRRLWVADSGNNRVVSFYADATNGTAPSATAAILGSSPTISALLDGPLGVALSRDNQSVWVTNTQDGGLVQFNATTGAVARVFTGDQLRLSYSQIIAVDAVGMVYISDGTYNVVRKFDARSGALLQNYTQPATVATWEPVGVTVDDTSLYVGDFISKSVFKMALDTGEVVAQFDVSRGLGTGYSYPSGLTIDSLGWLYVADRERVWKFNTSSGDMVAMWNWTTLNMEPTQKASFQFTPIGVVCDSDLLYVSNYAQVYVFSNLNEPRPTPARNAGVVFGSCLTILLCITLAHSIAMLFAPW